MNKKQVGFLVHGAFLVLYVVVARTQSLATDEAIRGAANVKTLSTASSPTTASATNATVKRSIFRLIKKPVTTITKTYTTSAATINLSSGSSPYDQRDRECGIPRETAHHLRQRIIGGLLAGECEFPWTVLIEANDFVCGGSVIDPWHVLTAAHCVLDDDLVQLKPDNLSVVAGSSSTSRGQRFKVANITAHEGYNTKNNTYDVAVLTVDEEFVYSECLRPICLPEAGSEPSGATSCTVAGWGDTGETEGQYTPNLNKVDLPLVDQALCQKRYGAARVNDLMLCAGHYKTGGKDACQGDSGGPLMCRVREQFVVHGIVSSGRRCGQRHYPSIFTRVAHPEIKGFIKMATGRS